MASWEATLNTIEEACFQYLRGLIPGAIDETCFIGELPDVFGDQSEDFIWQFSVLGGDEPLDYEFAMNSGESGTEQQFECEFEGLFNSRSRARQIQGTLMDNLPVAEYAIDNVRRFRPRRHPTLTRDVIERVQSQSKGGLVRVWRLSYPLEVLFDRSTI